MNQKKVKEIRRNVESLAGDRIRELAYQQSPVTGAIKVAPMSKRGMVKAMKSTIKGKK